MVDEPMSGTLPIVVTLWRSAVLQRSSSAVRYSPLEPDEGTCAALCHGMSEGGTGSDAGLVLTRLHKPRLLFLRWPSREVEVHHHWRMVAACRYTLLVEVLDVPHNPMAADPDRIVAPLRARRVLPPPSPVGDGKGPERLASPKPVHLIGMKGEPARHRDREPCQGRTDDHLQPRR